MDTSNIDPNDPKILDPEQYDIISDEEIEEFKQAVSPLIGLQLSLLEIPDDALQGFEPSQIGTITGDLMDASIPQLGEIALDEDEVLGEIGLEQHAGILGEREGYPDYLHESGVRAELKLLYVDPPGDIDLKSPPTPREPSGRLDQKVTLKNVEPDKDVLMVVAYQLQRNEEDERLVSPTITDIGVFPMIECILARDMRLQKSGRWFGDFETPAIISRVGKKKIDKGERLDKSTYGRKASEGKDFNEDTNFGKMKRIPYKPLQKFIGRHGQDYARTGVYPEEWEISSDPSQRTVLDEE